MSQLDPDAMILQQNLLFLERGNHVLPIDFRLFENIDAKVLGEQSLINKAYGILLMSVTLQIAELGFVKDKLAVVEYAASSSSSSPILLIHTSRSANTASRSAESILTAPLLPEHSRMSFKDAVRVYSVVPPD